MPLFLVFNIWYLFRVNICRDTEEETTELCRKLQDQVFTKWIANKSEQFTQMIDALLEGFWYIDVALDKDAMMYFWYDLNGLTCKYSISLLAE